MTENFLRPKYAVFASGEGSIFQAIIDAQNRDEIPGDLALLITDKSFCGAKNKAEQEGISALVFSPDKYQDRQFMDREIKTALQARNIEYIILAGYMRFITKPLLTAYHHRIINTHPSLLPAFKGKDAVKQAYEYGVKVTGCTVHLVTEELDGGPILLQEPVRIYQGDSLETLHERIKEQERDLMTTALKALLTDKFVVESNHRWVTS